MFLFFTVSTGPARFQSAAIRSILRGEAEEPFRDDPGELIAGLFTIQELSSAEPCVQLKLLQLKQVLSLIRHFN